MDFTMQKVALYVMDQDVSDSFVFGIRVLLYRVRINALSTLTLYFCIFRLSPYGRSSTLLRKSNRVSR